MPTNRAQIIQGGRRTTPYYQTARGLVRTVTVVAKLLDDIDASFPARLLGGSSAAAGGLLTIPDTSLHPLVHQEVIDVLAWAKLNFAKAPAFFDEAELLVERNRWLVVGQHCEAHLLDARVFLSPLQKH